MNIQKLNPISGEFDYYNLEVFYNNLGTVIENTIGDPSTLTPNTGDRYIPLNPSIGDWLGQYPNIATWNGTSWIYYNPLLNDRVTITIGINSGKVYNFDGTNWIEQTTTSNDWIVGGNVLTSLGSFGSLTNQSVNFITNNIEAARIDTSQRLLIGTATTLGTTQKLQLKGSGIFDNTGYLGSKINGGAYTFSTDASYKISGLHTGTRLTLNNTLRVFGETGGNYFVSENCSLNQVTTNAGTYDIGIARILGTSNRLRLSHTGTLEEDASAQSGSVGCFNEMLVDGAITMTPLSKCGVTISQFVALNTVASTYGDFALNRCQIRSNALNNSVFNNFYFYDAQCSNIGVNAIITGIIRGAAYHVSSNLDLLPGDIYSILSETNSRSFHLGSFEFGTDIKLKGISNYVTINANSATTPYTLTLPTDAGTNGYVLTTDGLGQTSWTNASSNDIPEWIAPPLTSTSTGLQGQKAQDATWIYFCYADNEWARTPRDLTIW